MAIVAAEQFDDLEQEYEASRLGMWTFLATEVLFFGVLFAAYTVTRLMHPQGFVTANHHTNLISGSIETVILLSSGATMAFAVHAAKQGWHKLAFRMLVVTLALGLASIAIPLMGYYGHYEEGLIPAVNWTYEGPRPNEVKLFFFLYYVMTGFHLLHVAVGVAILAVIAVLAWRRWFGPEYSTPVELTGLYWNFVNTVWVFLFPSFYLVSRA